MATSKKVTAEKQTEAVAQEQAELDELEQLKLENAKLQAKNDAIMAMFGSGTIMQKSGTSAEDAALIESLTERNKEMTEKVTKTYYSRNNNEKDIKVGVNGKLFIIKLGVPVEIPKYVAEVIEHSYNQVDEVNSLIEAKTEERAQMDKALG